MTNIKNEPFTHNGIKLIEKINESKWGIKYHIIETTTPVTSTTAFGIEPNDRRITIKGNIALEKTSDSQVYGDEIQIVIYDPTDTPLISTRAKTYKKFSRVEIEIPKDTGVALIESFCKRVLNKSNNISDYF